MGIPVIVNSKLISNGLFEIYNDGYNFGPDTENTETFGISEAMAQENIVLLKVERYPCRKPLII